MNETIALVAPVSRHRIEHWVEEQVDAMRGGAAATGVWLGRFRAAWAQEEADWAVEIDARERDVPPQHDLALASVLTHLERLGLSPQLWVSAPSETPAVGASTAHAPAR